MRPTLTQDHPTPAVYSPEAGEAALRGLYAHPADTVRLGMIAAANGAATGPDGSSRSLNGPADLRILLVLRALADVVLVGARTARIESYGDITLPRDLADARVQAGLAPAPALALVTASADLPPGLTPARTWIVTTASSAAARLADERGAQVIVAGDEDLDMDSVIAQLGQHGMGRVLCEGGPDVADRLLRAGRVDDWCLTTSPVPGDGPQMPTPTGTLAHRLHADGFRMERWLTGGA